MENWLGLFHPFITHFTIACPILAFILLSWGIGESPSWLDKTIGVLWIVTFITALGAFLTGPALSLKLGITSEASWIPSPSILHGQLQEHALWGIGSLVLSIIGLIAAGQIFKDQPWPRGIHLALGFLLAVTFGVTGYQGIAMTYGVHLSTSSMPLNATPPGDLFNSLGDFHQTLVKMNSRPWNSRPHNGLWLNTYVSKNAVEAYENSNPMPLGSVVVNESFEDQNNQPSHIPGPLYLMEKVALSDAPQTHGWLYALSWEKPISHHSEKTQGPIEWLPGDPHLNSCIICHSRFKDEDYMAGVPDGFEKY